MKMTYENKTVEYVEVDVNPVDILMKIYERSIPAGLEYLSATDGWWYCADGFDYHKREDRYRKVRPATDDEVQFYEAYQLLKNFARNI